MILCRLFICIRPNDVILPRTPGFYEEILVIIIIMYYGLISQAGVPGMCGLD